MGNTILGCNITKGYSTQLYLYYIDLYLTSYTNKSDKISDASHLFFYCNNRNELQYVYKYTDEKF